MKVPEAVEVEIEGNVVRVKGPKGVLEKRFNSRLFEAKAESREFVLVPRKKESKRVLAARKTIEAHVRNMARGVCGNYEKRLLIVYAHFPISVEVKGKEIIIKNFMGEKTPRKAEIRGDAKVSVSGQEIVVSGSDKEAVGQTASNIVKATRILNRDERVFQDGIYYSD